MEPADRPVTLSGTIRLIHGYGPPGWGETKKIDQKFTYLVIDLPKPINIPCTPERPEWASSDCAATNRLRLFFSSSRSGDKLEPEVTANKMIGRLATLTGKLDRRSTVGEMTPIYITITKIEAGTRSQ